MTGKVPWNQSSSQNLRCSALILDPETKLLVRIAGITRGKREYRTLTGTRNASARPDGPNHARESNISTVRFALVTVNLESMSSTIVRLEGELVITTRSQFRGARSISKCP